VINGGGKIGEYLATTLLKNRHQVAIIELNEQKVEHLALVLENQVMVICGDGCDSSYQADAGIVDADIFVATTGSDDVNLVSCELAQLIHHVPRCIARVNSPKNERIFKSMGIEAVSSTQVISRLIEREAIQGARRAAMTLLGGDLILTEIKVPETAADAADAQKKQPPVPSAQNSKAPAKSLCVSDIRLPNDSLLVAVGHDGTLEVVKGSTKLYAGDTIVCVSKRDVDEEQVKRALAEAFESQPQTQP